MARFRQRPAPILIPGNSVPNGPNNFTRAPKFVSNNVPIFAGIAKSNNNKKNKANKQNGFPIVGQFQNIANPHLMHFNTQSRPMITVPQKGSKKVRFGSEVQVVEIQPDRKVRKGKNPKNYIGATGNVQVQEGSYQWAPNTAPHTQWTGGKSHAKNRFPQTTHTPTWSHGHNNNTFTSHAQNGPAWDDLWTNICDNNGNPRVSSHDLLQIIHNLRPQSSNAPAQAQTQVAQHHYHPSFPAPVVFSSTLDQWAEKFRLLVSNPTVYASSIEDYHDRLGRALCELEHLFRTTGGQIPLPDAYLDFVRRLYLEIQNAPDAPHILAATDVFRPSVFPPDVARCWGALAHCGGMDANGDVAMHGNDCWCGCSGGVPHAVRAYVASLERDAHVLRVASSSMLYMIQHLSRRQ